MTKKQKRMIAAVKYMQNYVVTYDKQHGYESYSDDTFIQDMLYGVARALGYKVGAEGLEKFKADIGIGK